ncbi:hypothetical protein AMTRI_Chr03g53910 [Amborella trichopoda]
MALMLSKSSSVGSKSTEKNLDPNYEKPNCSSDLLEESQWVQSPWIRRLKPSFTLIDGDLDPMAIVGSGQDLYSPCNSFQATKNLSNTGCGGSKTILAQRTTASTIESRAQSGVGFGHHFRVFHSWPEKERALSNGDFVTDFGPFQVRPRNPNSSRPNDRPLCSSDLLSQRKFHVWVKRLADQVRENPGCHERIHEDAAELGNGGHGDGCVGEEPLFNRNNCVSDDIRKGNLESKIQVKFSPRVNESTGVKRPILEWGLSERGKGMGSDFCSKRNGKQVEQSGLVCHGVSSFFQPLAPKGLPFVKNCNNSLLTKRNEILDFRSNTERTENSNFEMDQSTLRSHPTPQEKIVGLGGACFLSSSETNFSKYKRDEYLFHQGESKSFHPQLSLSRSYDPWPKKAFGAQCISRRKGYTYFGTPYDSSSCQNSRGRCLSRHHNALPLSERPAASCASEPKTISPMRRNSLFHPQDSNTVPNSSSMFPAFNVGKKVAKKGTLKLIASFPQS